MTYPYWYDKSAYDRYNKKPKETKESKTMTDSFGFTMNSAGTIDKNGRANLGIHLVADNGDGTPIDIDRHAEGDDMNDLAKTLVEGVLKEYKDKHAKAIADKASKEKEQKANRDKKRADLQKQIADLQDQLNALDKVEKRQVQDTKNFVDDFVSNLSDLEKFFFDL